jgi:hypothetical protein
LRIELGTWETKEEAQKKLGKFGERVVSHETFPSYMSLELLEAMVLTTDTDGARPTELLSLITLLDFAFQRGRDFRRW